MAGFGSATLSWVAPYDNGKPITGYTVVANIGYFVFSFSFQSPATTQVITGLTPGTAVNFRVSAVNADGGSPLSPFSGPVTILAPVPPGAPATPTAVTGGSAAVVSWVAPSDNGSPITGYTVSVYQGYFLVAQLTFASTETTQTVSGLTGGTTLRFKVAAINAGGTGPQSKASGPVVIRPASLPSAPAAPTAVAIPDTGTAEVSWSAPADNGYPITGYTVSVYQGYFLVAQLTFASTETTQTIGALPLSKTLRFRVAAINGDGTGPQSINSNPVIVTEPPRVFTPPDAPAAPTATAGVESATLSWVAPYDNGKPITGYTVVANIGYFVFSFSFQSPATTQVITGLTPGTAVNFRVSAVNADGGSPLSPFSGPVTILGPAASAAATENTPTSTSAPTTPTTPSLAPTRA